MHKNLYTSNHHEKCVETGYKVYNPNLRNTNFIPNLLNMLHAFLITFNQLLNTFARTSVYLQVPLFLCICVLTSQYFYAKYCVTIGVVFITLTFLINIFFKICDNCVFVHFKMIEGSFVGSW